MRDTLNGTGWTSLLFKIEDMVAGGADLRPKDIVQGREGVGVWRMTDNHHLDRQPSPFDRDGPWATDENLPRGDVDATFSNPVLLREGRNVFLFRFSVIRAAGPMAPLAARNESALEMAVTRAAQRAMKAGGLEDSKAAADASAPSRHGCGYPTGSSSTGSFADAAESTRRNTAHKAEEGRFTIWSTQSTTQGRHDRRRDHDTKLGRLSQPNEVGGQSSKRTSGTRCSDRNAAERGDCCFRYGRGHDCTDSKAFRDDEQRSSCSESDTGAAC
ncbi:hypothetical protein HDU96_004767 [Phlyctochytrium bullatum]|nr:hypothetical protein HDU96_004767 [Phlyctochytrium bullatum]